MNTIPTRNTFLVYSRVMNDGKQTHLTEDRVIAADKDGAAKKIEARGNHIVTSVILAQRGA